MVYFIFPDCNIGNNHVWIIIAGDLQELAMLVQMIHVYQTGISEQG